MAKGNKNTIATTQRQNDKVKGPIASLKPLATTKLPDHKRVVAIAQANPNSIGLDVMNNYSWVTVL